MKGALPYQEIQMLREAGYLVDFADDALQPASIDLSISDEVYRLKGSILPQNTESVRDLLKNAVRFPHDLQRPLEPGESYLCKIQETVRLPQELYAYTNPKSSSGRNDIQVRLLADGVPRFDTVPNGFSGELWLLVSSRHFFLRLSMGDRLSQLRIFDGDTRFDRLSMELSYDVTKFLWDPHAQSIPYHQLETSDKDGSLILSIDLESEDLVGYKAKPAAMTPVLEFNTQGHNADEFFVPLHRKRDNHLVLEQSQFYIFYTYEFARVPPTFAAEMAAMDERAGEFRSHYAGFIDPGWGYGRSGQEKGWPLVLEMRPFDNNLIVRHRQPICKLRYERVRLEPERVYGETGSNYIRQHGAMLSKHFRPHEALPSGQPQNETIS